MVYDTFNTWSVGPIVNDTFEYVCLMAVIWLKIWPCFFFLQMNLLQLNNIF